MLPIEIDHRVLGQRIAEARKARGKTQEEVAEFLGFSRPTYIAIEKGERRPSPTRSSNWPHSSAARSTTWSAPRAGDRPAAASSGRRRQVENRRSVRPAQRSHRTAPVACRGLSGARANDGGATPDELSPEIVLNLGRRGRTGRSRRRARTETTRAGGRARDRPSQYAGVGCRFADLLHDGLPSSIAGMYAYSAELGGCVLINRNHPPDVVGSRCSMSMATFC